MLTNPYNYNLYYPYDGAMIFILIVVLVLAIVTLVGKWKLIAKTGKPGWSAIVPFYASYCEFSVFWGCGWLFLVPIVLGCLRAIPLISLLASIAVIVIEVLHQYKKALAFGKGIGFACGLIFLAPIFNCILGFGSDKYLGVPQDGTSYKQIRAKLGKVEENVKDMKFEEAPKDEEIRVDYEQLEVKAEPVEPAKVVDVDLREEEKKEDKE